jgi:hypothetical protein
MAVPESFDKLRNHDSTKGRIVSRDRCLRSLSLSKGSIQVSEVPEPVEGPEDTDGLEDTEGLEDRG